jgi:hypothetical protein
VGALAQRARADELVPGFGAKPVRQFVMRQHVFDGDALFERGEVDVRVRSHKQTPPRILISKEAVCFPLYQVLAICSMEPPTQAYSRLRRRRGARGDVYRQGGIRSPLPSHGAVA